MAEGWRESCLRKPSIKKKIAEKKSQPKNHTVPVFWPKP